MSNALAVAAVSAVLKDLLNNGLIDHDVSTAVGSPVVVSALPPDRIKTGDVDEQPQLNLFLYQVAPNLGWQNVGLPSRDDQGARLTNPPLALDLRYLLTAYGKNDFDGEILLGYAMQLLHETPVLPRDAIRTALGPSPPGVGGPPVTGGILPIGPLSASDLADQVEQIKISPQNLNTEEMSKLWTATLAHYRPTAAYHVSVVLIESKRSTRSALPVRSRNVYVLPFDQPVIEQVVSGASANADPRIALSSTLVLIGRKLKGPVTLVRLGDLELPPPPSPPPVLDISDTRISFPLGLLTTLQAGVQTVQVIHQIPMGQPEVAHRGFESNAAAFMLHPTITVAIGNITSTVVNTDTIFSATVTAAFVPNVGRTQRVMLLLNEFSAPGTRPSRAYSFPAPTTNGITDPIQKDTDSIAFSISGVLGGDYLVRVQVDGAESLLAQNAAGQ